MLFLSRAESLPTNSSYAAWIFYHLSIINEVICLCDFCYCHNILRLGVQEKKKRNCRCQCLSHPGCPDCSHLVSTCRGRSVAHGGPSATQSSGGAGVKTQLGSPGRGTRCTFIIVTGAHKQQRYSANASVFTHSASRHHNNKGLPRSMCLLKWIKIWKNFPPAT